MTNQTVSPYKQALTNAMDFLSTQKDIIFIGQQIVFPGNPMSTTLLNVDKSLMLELPVMEEIQMGMSLGLAMTGKTVVSFYPRWDFIISASNQLINHLDKFEIMTGNRANILIRLGKGSDNPLDPGVQHKGNYFHEYQSLCKNIKFHNLTDHSMIENIYIDAYKTGGVHVLVEYPELYFK